MISRCQPFKLVCEFNLVWGDSVTIAPERRFCLTHILNDRILIIIYGQLSHWKPLVVFWDVLWCLIKLFNGLRNRQPRSIIANSFITTNFLLSREDLPVDLVELILDLSVDAQRDVFLLRFSRIKNSFICSQFGISSLLYNKLLRIKLYIGVLKIIRRLLHQFFGPFNLIIFISDSTVNLFVTEYPLCSCRFLEVSKMVLNPVVPFPNFDLLSLAL